MRSHVRLVDMARPLAAATAPRHTLALLAALLLVTAAHIAPEAAQASRAPAAHAAQPASADSLIARGERALNHNQADQAERFFRDALKVSKNDARAEHGLAVVGLMRDDADAAIDHARSAVKRDKKNAKYHLTLANGYGMKALKGGLTAMFYGGKFKQECEAAIECDPNYVPAYMGILQYYVMAPAIAGGGRDKANETVATVARLDPYSGHMARAFIARQDKDLASAEREYRAAARVDSLDPKGWRAVGSFYMEQKRYGDAIKAGDRILKLDPKDLPTVYQLAKAHLLLGDDLKAAESGFKRYIAEARATDSPGPAAAHWRLGMVYEKAGRLADAKAEWERAVELDPTEKHAVAALDSLRKARPELGK